MGFSAIAPRIDQSLVVKVIDLWSRRADAAIISEEPPWAELLAGVDPATLVSQTRVPLANYYRSKGHQLWVYLDPANGVNRAGESDALVAAGRSLTEPAVQMLFRRYAVEMDRQLHPEHMGLTLETNLIRALSPPALYAAVRRVANDAAADVRAGNGAARLGVSVQVDWAWGYGANGAFQGVATDFADFPFTQELGLSSYPYLAAVKTPEDLPLDYYSRLAEGRSVPVMVTEGGWTSSSLGSVVSSDVQRRYIVRQMEILDRAGAIAVFQLTFTDLDLPALSLPADSIIPVFAYNGLVDVNLQPKPALAAWDEAFARPRGN
jgi:hypothetical protein